MEVLHQLLSPYSEVVAKTAVTLNIVNFFSGVFLLSDILRKGTTKGFSILPFLGGTVLSVLFTKLGTLIGDDTVVKVNLFGFAINVIYLCLFYFYTPPANKTKVWGQIGVGGLFGIGCIAYTSYEDPKFVEFRYSVLVTLIWASLVASPLINLGTIIRTKNSSLPLPFIVTGTAVSTAWLVYGLSVNNAVIVAQNGLVVALSVFQLLLCFVYPSESPKPKGKKKKN